MMASSASLLLRTVSVNSRCSWLRFVPSRARHTDDDGIHGGTGFRGSYSPEFALLACVAASAVSFACAWLPAPPPLHGDVARNAKVANGFVSPVIRIFTDVSVQTVPPSPQHLDLERDGARLNALLHSRHQLVQPRREAVAVTW